MRVNVRLTAIVLSTMMVSGCAARRATHAVGVPARSSSAPTIEGSDPRLSAALLAEMLRPSAEAHLQVAREYRRLQILDTAHARIERALARAPRFAAAHEEMARVWRDWGAADAALGPAWRAVYFAHGSASAHNTLGTVLDAIGDLDGARQAYAEALTLDPTAGWALNNLCSVEFRLGRFGEALQQCEAAVRTSPALAAAHNNLGLTWAATGDIDHARKAFVAAGDLAAAHYNVGIVHLSHGRYLEAALEFEQAIKERPTFTAAKTRAHDARLRVLTAR